MHETAKSTTGNNVDISSVSRKFPSYRKSLIVSVEGWLNGKRMDDEAEGLWRIHDTLYDFTDFVNDHPGGAFWLKQTKGMDITESFESHHIVSARPDNMLRKFKVRQAENPRNYTLTMHESGFYKTLKGRVRTKLKEIDFIPSRRTNIMHSSLLASTLSFVILRALTQNTVFNFFAAVSLCLLTIASHNYFHKKDNWRMYAFNLSLLNFSSWRVSHALSHHVYPNSLYDLEMALFEPFLCWVPDIRFASKLKRIISVFMQPIIYAIIFPFDFLTRTVSSVIKTNVLEWHDAVGFTLPLLMWAISHDHLLTILRQWLSIIMLSSFLFGLIGLTAAHHDPKIHHHGDANRVDRDWGIFQIDTIIDRKEIKGSQFLVLTTFGEHTLHHLFPTLDHGVLPQLYPILYETLNQFQLQLRECTQIEHIIGQSKQLLRTTPNLCPPEEGNRM